LEDVYYNLIVFSIFSPYRTERRREFFYISLHFECYNKDYKATTSLLYKEQKQLQNVTVSCNISAGWTELTEN